MKNIRSKIKELNWFGFIIVFLLCSLGACLNENVTGLEDWLVLMIFIGFPISLLVLIMSKRL
jgi:hypothetical protein